MRVVWKWALEMADRQTLLMPAGAEVLCVMAQAGEPALWALVDPDAERVERSFVVVGTGHRRVPEEGAFYVGSFMLMDGTFVGHVFEVPSP